MDISLHEIAESSCRFAGIMLTQGGVSESKILENTVGFSEANRTYVANIAIGAISKYHDALREKLLEQGIDIGFFTDDLDAPRPE